jgi:hypothetical protein
MAEMFLRYAKPICCWWALLEFLGILALPLAGAYFRLVPSRGYFYSKLIGLMLASYVLWLGASLLLCAGLFYPVFAVQARVSYVFLSGTEREEFGMSVENGACLQESLETVFEMGGTRVWAVPR